MGAFVGTYGKIMLFTHPIWKNKIKPCSWKPSSYGISAVESPMIEKKPRVVLETETITKEFFRIICKN